MGTYDTINVPCPKCGTKSGFQTKSGQCTLTEYELNEAPADVMEDVMRHGPATCRSCGTVFGVQFQIVSTVTAQSIVWPPEDINQCSDCKGSGNIGDPANQCITCGGLGDMEAYYNSMTPEEQWEFDKRNGTLDENNWRPARGDD